jgi:hypothetical protein
MLGLPKSSRNKDSVMVVVGYFSKIVHFISYSKTFNAINIDDLYFKEIARLYGILKTITSYQDFKFIRRRL